MCGLGVNDIVTHCFIHLFSSEQQRFNHFFVFPKYCNSVTDFLLVHSNDELQTKNKGKIFRGNFFNTFKETFR